MSSLASMSRVSERSEAALARGVIRSLVGAALAAPLLVYAWTGAFSRYVADDYCWAGLLRTDGFVGAQIAWYVGYSPRFAFTFIVNVVELAGPAIVPVLPTVAILVALGTTLWTQLQLGLQRGVAALLAPIAVLATLQTAPDMGQSLYWQTGMLTYLLPLVLCTFLVGWLARATRRARARGVGDTPRRHARRGKRIGSALVALLVAFVAGGLSEAYLIPQNVALTLSAIVCAVLLRGATRRVLLSHLLAALAGAVLALVLEVVAPSTPGRVGGPPGDVWLALSAAIATAAYQVARLVRYFAPTLLLCLLAPTLLVRLSQRESLLGEQDALPAPDRLSPQARRGAGRWFGVVSALVVVVLPFCYFPSFFAQNGNPPARSLIVPGAILIAYTVFAGCALRGWFEGQSNVLGRFGSGARQGRQTESVQGGAYPNDADPRSGFRPSDARRGWRVAPLCAAPGGVPLVALLASVVLMIGVPLGIAASSLPARAAAAAYAAEWDAEDALIRASRAQGQTDLTVPRLPPFLGEAFVGPDRDDWFNHCVARYYDVRTIASS